MKALLPLVAALLASLAAPAQAGERAQQRLAERHAEALAFPGLVAQCRRLPDLADAPWDDDLRTWRARRADTLAEAAALIEVLATANGQNRATVDEAIRQQAEARYSKADAGTLAFTCTRLRQTLRGEPYVPTIGASLDEDTQREVLDQLLPVAQTLLGCEAVERIVVRPAPPPVLRADASSMAALADRVEIWNTEGCGKVLDIELSLRFPEDEPPTFALGFPRAARPAAPAR